MLQKLGIRLILVGVIFILLAGAASVSFAQTEDAHYFPETGHVVSGAFLRFYEEVPDAEFLFGYPISVAFVDRLGTGKLVQYFQRARFEFDPENETAPFKVERSPLGEWLFVEGLPSLPDPNPSACIRLATPREDRPQAEVCYAFLEFFLAHGGVSIFGFPVDDFKFEDGRIVQYFMNAKLSWHPELPPGQKVQLSDVGRLYFYQQGEDPRHLMPNRTDGIPEREVTELKVKAFTEQAVVAGEGFQTLNVIARDQSLQPIPQVDIRFDVVFPDGRVESYGMSPTGENGITRLKFPVSVEASQIGMVEVRVSATLTSQEPQLSDRTVTSFRIWW